MYVWCTWQCVCWMHMTVCMSDAHDSVYVGCSWQCVCLMHMTACTSDAHDSMYVWCTWQCVCRMHMTVCMSDAHDSHLFPFAPCADQPSHVHHGTKPHLGVGVAQRGPTGPTSQHPQPCFWQTAGAHLQELSWRSCYLYGQGRPLHVGWCAGNGGLLLHSSSLCCLKSNLKPESQTSSLLHADLSFSFFLFCQPFLPVMHVFVVCVCLCVCVVCVCVGPRMHACVSACVCVCGNKTSISLCLCKCSRHMWDGVL